MIKAVTAAMIAFAVPSTAIGQDVPATQLEDHGQVVRQTMLTRSLLKQRGGRGSTVAMNPEARATCLNKRQAVRNLGADHPKVGKLYALCAQAGY